jgi:transposase
MSDCDHEKIITQLQEEIKLLKAIIEKLAESNKDLQKRLSYYENPHSPPSKNSLEWRKQKQDARKNRDSDSSKSKRGGIPGHKGATQKFISTNTVHHKSSECPKCGSADIFQTKTRKRVMVGIPQPIPYVVTEHVLYQYNCESCSDDFQTDGNLPPCGNFDGSTIREVTSLFSKRMPYDTIRITLQERYGLIVSCTTVQSILRTASTLLEPFYKNIHKKIVTASIVGIDETTFPIEGKMGWMWVARTRTEAHYALEYSRGSKILKKYWKKFSGILVSDGYVSYRTVLFDNLRQRCTAHLQRDAKYLASKSKDKQAKNLYGEFSDMLHRARVWSVQKHSEKQREKYKENMLKKTDCIIQQYMTGNVEMIQFGKKLKTARNSLFTFVIHSEVPSTNNDTENAVRKCIMQRNVRGQMKSNQGMKMLSVFLTCFETWRIRGLNMFFEMAKYI